MSKIGFLTGHLRQKNPIFSKNRIFNSGLCQKKIRFFQKIGFLTGHLRQKKIGLVGDLSPTTNYELIWIISAAQFPSF
jgi:hypothetical protein